MTAPAPELRVLGRVRPSREQRADVLFGWPLLEELARLKVGAALAVRERDVVAAQADEPLPAVIDRAGTLCRRRTWTLLVAGASADGSMIASLARARCRCLALPGSDADRAALAGAADAAGVALVEVR